MSEADDLDADTLADQLNHVEKYGPEMTALRKLIYRLAGIGADDPIPDDYTLHDATEDALDNLETMLQLVDDLDKIEDAIATAETALAVADRHARDEADMTKQRAAAKLTRNQLVKQAALGDGTTVTVSRIQTLGEPRHDFAYQTVKNAWQSLATDWPAFHVTENEAGTRVCRVERRDITAELVRVVEHDLGRDDLAKRFNTDCRGGRG